LYNVPQNYCTWGTLYHIEGKRTMADEIDPAMYDLLDNLSKYETAKCPDCGNAMTIKRGDDDPECPQNCGPMTERYDPPQETKTIPEVDKLAQYIREGTAARGVDKWAVEDIGYSASSWANLTGRDRSTVSRNVRRTEDDDE